MSKAAAQFIKAKQLLQKGDNAAAEKLLQKVVKHDKANFEAWFLLGNLHGAKGEHNKARSAFQQVLRINPRVAEAHNNIARSYIQQQRWNDAIPPLRDALKISPHYDAACVALIEAYERIKDDQSALKICQQWLQLRPGDAQRHMRAGILCQAVNDYPLAATYYQQACELGAKDYSLYLNSGVVQQHLHQYHAAIELYNLALELNPDCAITHYNMAACYYALGHLDKGELLAQQALKIMPGLHRARAMLLLNLNYKVPYDSAMVRQRHVELAEPLVVERNTPFVNIPQGDRKLRIGYVSDGFHNNPVATFLMPILAAHNSQQFDIFCYADVPNPDEVTLQLQVLVDQWRDISGIDDEQFGTIIEQDQIDILVDMDGYLNPHFTRFARQNAPIQVSYLGYPATSGLSTIQYRITDDVVDPVNGNDEHYSEQLLRLKHSFFCYQPPTIEVEPSDSPVASGKPFTFGSFNKLPKLNDEVFGLWADILKSSPKSRLLMQNEASSSEQGRAQIRDLFLRLGVLEQQLVFSPYGTMSQYLEAHQQVDLMLDSFPWNGHTNTCHALWMGVPTLTLKGQHFAGRFGYAIMHAVDAPSFVADNPQQYAEIANAFAEDPTQLIELRHQWRKRLLDSKLCDAESITKSLEQLYGKIWQDWCEGVNAEQH